MSDDIPAEIQEMSRARLEYWAMAQRADPTKAGQARAEIWRRDTEERRQIAMRQERVAWAAVVAAGIAAFATVVLAVIAWMQT